MHRRAAVILILSVLVVSGSKAAPAARSLTLDDRAAAAEAIERVYWAHRIWPSQNPGPKPAFESVVSRESLRGRVEDSLRLSNALERLWNRPITHEQLQAELDRMVAGSKQPSVLREIFDALGNDPFVIAECLARPVLAERISRSLYARDERFHGDLRRRAEAAAGSLRAPDDLKRSGGEYFEMTRALDRSARDPVPPSGRKTASMDEDSWKRYRLRLAARFKEPGARIREDEPLALGRISRLAEDDDVFSVETVLGDDGDTVTTAAAVWRKTPFASWWSANRAGFASELDAPPGAYSVAAPASGCTNDTWTATRYEVPDPRLNHTAVWTGTEMIVWGGEVDFTLDTGGRYNPATDSWTVTSRGTNVPFSRSRHTAVWTGTEMIVWGGYHPFASLNTGARYDPVADSWTPTGTGTNLPTSREDHTAVWTGTEMIVWGGLNETTYARYNTGGRYNPSTDSWTATTTTGSPAGRDKHTAVWTGSEMIVFGGNNAGLSYLNDGSRYKPSTNSWTAIALFPTFGRIRHSAVWSGTEMIVFGGFNGVGYLNSGGRYNPTTNTWTLTSVGTNVPSIRGYHTAVWTGSQMVVYGGYDGTNYLATGGRYTPSFDSWTPTSTTGVDAPRAAHTAVWSGTEMLVWGGLNTYDYLVFGGRYTPSTDSWTLMSAGNTIPAARYFHTSTWTGSEMVMVGGVNEYFVADAWRYTPATDVWTAAGGGAGARYLHTALWDGKDVIAWGGYDLTDALQTGARFDPATSVWTPMGTGPGVPEKRGDFAAVWDGRRMIVWGGYNGAVALATGGRYDPTSDAWSPTSTIGAPSARSNHAAVWSGTAMLAWGGTPDGTVAVATGGRYDPVSDSWSPVTSTGAPSARWSAVAVWTGDRMVIQGGYDGTTWVGTGSRYDPVGDAWYPTISFASARAGHTAVWTGSDMLVWGGYAGGYLGTGSRYDPATDTSVATAAIGAPSARSVHSAVWTGERMLVWGGSPATSTGGAYCSVPSCSVASWYRDADGDGYGNGTDVVLACSQPVGYIAGAGDCDDSSATVRPGAAEVCDGLDNDCDGLTDNVPVPGAVANIVESRLGTIATISWTAPSGAQGHDVVRGSLSALRLTGGDFSTATTDCLANDLAGTTANDPDVPSAGDGFWHLVRASNCGGRGTYDDGEPSQSSPRDAGISAAGGACP